MRSICMVAAVANFRTQSSYLITLVSLILFMTGVLSQKTSKTFALIECVSNNCRVCGSLVCTAQR